MPKILLEENEIPTHYYNILADLPFGIDPPLNPKTKQPIGPADLARIFPMELIKQEVSLERYIAIPDEVRKAYMLYRPTPLIRARRLEQLLDTPAKIYYKNESVSPVGSHKLNTALAQAFYNKAEGVKRLATETGAGQWGSALSFACHYFGLECMVYMVKISFEQKPYRKILMQLFNGKVVASPSSLTEFGKKLLEEDVNNSGSLGIAISEAIEDAVTHEGTKYALGSVLNHVLLHQTIIGLETKKQLEKVGDFPDIIIGCHGGGSNFAGLAFPFLAYKLSGKKPDLRAIAVEPKVCPSLTEGKYEYDFGDSAQMTPLMKMKTLGAQFMPPKIHAGGLRYHGASPIVSALYEHKIIEARALESKDAFAAGVMFAQNQGIVPAPESCFAIKAAIDEALVCKKEGVSKAIVFNLSGHGHFDMQAYADYINGNLKVSEE